MMKTGPIRLAAAQSFREPEINFLVQVLNALASGADTKVMLKARKEDFNNIRRKVLAMSRRLEAQKIARMEAEKT